MSKSNVNKEIATKILELIGGKENVSVVAHCMTRLRLTLNDESKADMESIKKIDGVMGCVKQEGQLQIILGPGKVNKVCSEFEGLTGMKVGEASDIGDGKALKDSINKKNQTPVKKLLKNISNIFIPLIPGFIACGLIMSLNNALTKFAPGWEGGQLALLLGAMGSAVFGILNVIVGYNANKEFGGSPIIGAILASIVTAPALADVVIFGNNIVPGRGGVISILAISALASFLEKKVRKIIPEVLDLFLTPLIVVILSTAIALIAIQPVGGFISDGIANMAIIGIEKGGPLVGFILAGLFLPLVMTGVHHGLTPIHAQLIESVGFTVLLPILAMAGAGQVGASFAVYVKTKNKRLKKTVASALIPGVLGVGEPLIYGVTLPLGKPFIGACIGGGIGGAVMALFKVGAVGMGVSGVLLAPLTTNALMYLVSVACAYVGGFIATTLIGFDDPQE